MSEYMCDICSRTLERTAVTFHAAATMHRRFVTDSTPGRRPGSTCPSPRASPDRSARVLTSSTSLGVTSFGVSARWPTQRTGSVPACTQAVARVSGAVPGGATPAPHRDYGAAFAAALRSSSPRIAVGVARFEAEIASDPETAEKRFWLGAAYLTAAGAEKSAALLDERLSSSSGRCSSIPCTGTATRSFSAPT